MLTPYENIIIGNFLYGLGLAMGAQPRPAAGSINLLQQTPLDRPLGDVMVHYPGALRLIEFKRTQADWGKEQAKYQSLTSALSARPHLFDVSRQVHWFVESGKLIDARPYLDLNAASDKGVSLEDFAAAVVKDGLGAQAFSPSVLHEYLNAVATFAGVRDRMAPGLLVTVDGTGTLRYVAVENILDLRITAQQLLARSLEAYQEGRELAHRRAQMLERSTPQRASPGESQQDSELRRQRSQQQSIGR